MNFLIKRMVALFVATIMLLSVGVTIAVAEPSTVVTTVSALQTAVAGATGGTENSPVEIGISGMLVLNSSINIPTGTCVRLKGVGAGENGLIRGSGFSGTDMLRGSANSTLILDGVVLDGGAKWANAVGGTNNGVSAGNSSIAYVEVGGKLVIDGGTVLRNNHKSGQGSAVYSKGTLEIVDGVLCDNATKGTHVHGGAVATKQTDATEVILRSKAVIRNNYATGDGGGIYQERGSVYINGATLSNNTVASGKSGGAIYACQNAKKIVVNSGEFKGNSARAIFVQAGNADIELYDCDISENFYEGVFLNRNYTGTVKLGGSTRITDNSITGLYFNSNYNARPCIEITKPFTSDAKIKISHTGAFYDGCVLAVKSDDFIGDFNTAVDVFDVGDDTLTPTVVGNLLVLLDEDSNGCGCESGFVAGKGTQTSPYLIATKEGLRHIEAHPDANYVLAASIDLSGDLWTPLCDSNAFSGVLDGNGKTVSGITMHGGENIGLFARLSKTARVCDLTVSGAVSTDAATVYAGGLAAQSYASLMNVVSDVDIDVDDTTRGADIGGVVGFNGGTVGFCTYNGNVNSGSNCNIGAIIGQSKVIYTPMLATIITAHSGFGAASDAANLKVDNTIDNIIHSVNYGPDAVEVDVRYHDANGNGVISTDEIVLGHDAAHAATGEKLRDALNLLNGKHTRSSELNPKYADSVKIQLDMKVTDIYPQIFELLDEIEFPYNRIILVGEPATYKQNTTLCAKVLAADKQGMSFWCGNPDEFVKGWQSLGVKNAVLNINYTTLTDEMLQMTSAAGYGVSVWTLNTLDALEAYMLRGVYNITTRMQEALPMREQIKARGVLGNTFAKGLSEIGAGTTGVHGKLQIITDEKPTCSKEGKGHTICGYCGVTVESDVVILATGEHIAGEWVTVKEATLLKTGVKECRCSVCGTLIDTDIIEKIIGTDTLTVFKDIKKSDWFVKNGSIDYAYNAGLFMGATDTAFEPQTAMTRGMFVTVLGRLHGVKAQKTATQFADVKKSAYYSGFVAWAAKNGIVSGVSATAFEPETNATREQICAIIYRYCVYAGVTLQSGGADTEFADADKISAYAKAAVNACRKGGIINGKENNRFDPKGKATRAEVATILMNFCKNYK